VEKNEYRKTGILLISDSHQQMQKQRREREKNQTD